MSDSAENTKTQLLACLRKAFLVCLGTFSVVEVYGQPFTRAVVLADGSGSPDIVLQTTKVTLDFQTLFGINDIYQLNVLRDRTPGEVTETDFNSIEAALARISTLSNEIPGSQLLVAFIFPQDAGPSASQIDESLKANAASVVILANAYFRSDLKSLSCGRFRVLDYATGVVSSRDTFIEKETHFPIIPVVVGGAAVTTGVILLTGKDNGGCTTVNPVWNVPAGLCADGSPVTLVPTGTTGGTWSGTGVTPTGVFDPGSGTQSITYTVGEGDCRQSRTQTVTVVDPDASWNIPSSPCADEAITLTPSSTGGTWSGSGVTQNPNGTATFIQEAAGSYEVTYSILISGCNASSTQSIEVFAAPDVSWSAPAEPLCAGEEATLTASGFTGGTWSGAGITDLGNGSATFVQNTAGTYAVTYAAISGNCSATLTQDISVIDQADATWVSPGELCTGDAVTLTPSGTAGGSWSGSGTTDHGDGTATFLSDTPGTFAVTYSVGTGACMASLTLDIEVAQTPDASWSPPSGSLCAGEEITLTPDGMAGGIWSGDGITDLGNGTAMFHNTSGTYTVTYSVINGNCNASASHDIVVIDIADPSWTAPDDLCTGDAVILSPTGDPGGTWSGTGVTDHGDGTATFSSDASGAFSVTYTVGSGACMASLTTDINVTQTPDASWTAPSNALCSGDSYDLTPTGTSGGLWSGQGVTDLGNGMGTFSNVDAGTYDITYTVMNGSCSASMTQQIMVIAQPDASWTPPADVCSGTEITLVPAGTQGGTWSGNDVTDLGNGTALFHPQGAGLYDITYTIGQGACEASLTQSVNVLLQPDATWTPPSGVCQDQVVTLVPDGTMGGSWLGSGVTDLGNGTAQFTQSETGLYDVTYLVTNGACRDSLVHQIEVVSLPDASWTVPDNVCTDAEFLLVPDGTQGGMWSGPGVTDQGNGTATFVQSDAGFYSVTYSVGQDVCMQELTQDIEVISPGDPAWDPPGDLICPGAVYDLAATEGTWSGDGVTDFGGGVGQFQAFDAGVYTVTLTVGSGDCTASESHDIEVGDADPPVIEIPVSDATVPCDGSGNPADLDAWLDNHGGAEATDVCSAVTWTNDFTDFNYDCGNAGMTTVTFTATDDSGNSATSVGVFIIEDTQPPMLEGVPQDIVAPCDAIPPPDPVSATDVCSGDATVSFEELPPGTGCPYEIVRIWTATDACGNTASAEQTIMATDDVPPEPQSAPHDTVIFCTGPPDLCIPPPEDVSFIDNCDPDPVVMMTEEIMPFPPNGLIVIRCWSATDACGNVSEAVCQNITIIGEEPNGQELHGQEEIMITIAMQPELESSYEFRDRIIPGSIDWHDPGLVLSPQLYATEKYTVLRTPPVGIDLHFRLDHNVILIAGGGIGSAEFFDRYGNDMLSAIVHEQFYHTGLRFMPKALTPVYFFTDLKYTGYRCTGLQLTNANQVWYSDSEPGLFMMTQYAGAGAQFKIGNFGSLELSTHYNSLNQAALYGNLKININSLIHSIGKTHRCVSGILSYY